METTVLDRQGTDSAEPAGTVVPIVSLSEDTASQLNGPDGRLMTIHLQSFDGRLAPVPCGSLRALEGVRGIPADIRARIITEVTKGGNTPKCLRIDGHLVSVSYPVPPPAPTEDIRQFIVDGTGRKPSGGEGAWCTRGKSGAS